MAQPIRILSAATDSPFTALAAYVGKAQEEGCTVLVVTSDRPQRQLAEVLGAAGVDLQRVHFLDVVTCMDGRPPVPAPLNTMFLPSPTMLEMMAMRIEQIAGRLPSPLVLVDSLSTLAFYNGPAAVQEFSHYLANRLRTRGIAADFLIRRTREGQALQDRVATFADGVVTLGGPA